MRINDNQLLINESTRIRDIIIKTGLVVEEHLVRGLAGNPDKIVWVAHGEANKEIFALFDKDFYNHVFDSDK